MLCAILYLHGHNFRAHLAHVTSKKAGCKIFLSTDFLIYIFRVYLLFGNFEHTCCTTETIFFVVEPLYTEFCTQKS